MQGSDHAYSSGCVQWCVAGLLVARGSNVIMWRALRSVRCVVFRRRFADGVIRRAIAKMLLAIATREVVWPATYRLRTLCPLRCG